MSYTDPKSSPYGNNLVRGQNPFSSVVPPQSRHKFIDTHSMLNNEIQSQGSDGGGISAGANHPISGQSAPLIIPVGPGVNDYYIYFDSEYADTFNGPAGQIVFLANQINKLVPIQNIIEIQVTSLYFPDISVATYNPSFYFYRRVAMTINELIAPATSVASTRTNYHFLFEADPAGIARILTPLSDKFIFKRPVQDISTLTFNFTAQNKIIPLPQEVWIVTQIADAGPSIFEFPGLHGLDPTTTHAVYISNYSNLTDPSLNPVFNDINGLFLTVVDATRVTILQPPAAAAALTAVNIPSIRMVIGARKVAFQMRFRSIDLLAPSNWITPV